MSLPTRPSTKSVRSSSEANNADRDVIRRTVRSALVCVVLAACGEDPTPPPPPPMPQVSSFDFLNGSWGVVSTYVANDGTTELTSAEAVTRSSLGGEARKEQWVGMRGGDSTEVLTMFIESDNINRWLVVRGDGGAGTFDILEGSFSSGVGTFTSRTGTRPDGGLIRETFSNVLEDTFEWQAERSDDNGQTWEVYWTMQYTRSQGTATLTSPSVAVGCSAGEYRQFDFWEGNWSVGSSTNDLPLLLGGCILEENWVSSERGTSYNMYDKRSGLWNQVWRDDNGNTLVIYGGLQGSSMVLTGPQSNSLQRITWTPNANGTVRQLGEGSGNNGQTWSTNFDITYVKR